MSRIKFRRVSGASTCHVGSLQTLFVEASQKLFQVDDTTSYVTEQLSQELSFHDLEAKLIKEGMELPAARVWLRQYLRFWSRQRLLRINLCDTSAPCCTYFAVGGRIIQVNCVDEALMDLIRPMLPSGVGDTAQFRSFYTLARLLDDVCIVAPDHALVVPLREAVPALKGMLTEELISNLSGQIQHSTVRSSEIRLAKFFYVDHREPGKPPWHSPW